jgi:WD40 repeat protein
VLARQESSVGDLSFSSDGRLLLSGVGIQRRSKTCHVYDIEASRQIATYAGHDGLVLATAVSPDARWAATGGGDDNQIHLWDPRTTGRRHGLDGGSLQLWGQGRPVRSVGFSPDVLQIGWGHSYHYQKANNWGPLEYCLSLPSAENPLPKTGVLSGAAASFFHRSVPEFEGLALFHRRGGQHNFSNAVLDIKLGEQAVTSIVRDISDGNRHIAYSFTPDGSGVVSGGVNGVLAAYNKNGSKQGGFLGHEDSIFAVALSPDGRFLLSGSADQTLRLWNLKFSRACWIFSDILSNQTGCTILKKRKRTNNSNYSICRNCLRK